ncbi:1,2-diacylglycerol 3-alpha-glucosyltransferase [Methylomarinovum caldicuralii]|uniref:1,2-diacylglycerol 3-alpha-glucosyltransferase n=1 Tax=Methylomarinovum caldicuralii TaxID=438856 RepID=A0AAU9CFI8_9GAMM|nr:glycosyltransferase [Methylomarinovum caldicuralii]BCX81740.1 1,2-diacylglycerol 3-alpha-glucosyltransferase [Methylomarinovum caldicuralii]
MRIGYISSYPPIECGIATYSAYLIDALREQGVDVYVVSHLGASGPQVFPAFNENDLDDKAYQVALRFTPDIVHVQHEFGLYGPHFGVNILPVIVKFRLIGVPVVTTLHTVYENPQPGHRVLIENILANSEQVIVHQDYQRRTLERLYPPQYSRKVTVIPHGARLVEPVADAKAKLGLPADRKVILMIGYFRPSKNFELIIDLLPEILRRYPDALLVLAGKIRNQEYAEYRNQLFEHIRRSPARDHIRVILGQLRQETFDTILSAADVVVLPYRITSQSGILAHCLAFGRPVVTSDTPAMRELIRQSGAGLIVASDDRYAEAIAELLGDEAKARSMGEAARRFVREKPAWPLIARRHVELYEGLMTHPDIGSQITVVD